MATFFITSCLYFHAHLKILRTIINDIDFEEFIEHHRNILKVALKFKNLFKEIVFFEYLFMTILLCVDGFQTIACNIISKKLNFFFHTVNSFVDLFIYSYGGQILMDSAMSVCDLNDKIDKNHVFLILKAQTELKIGNEFFSATLPFLCTILNRVMSLITLLQSFI